MNTMEMIIVAALAALTTGIGLEALSPEAREVSGQLVEIAKVQDARYAEMSVILGRPVVPVAPDWMDADELARIKEWAQTEAPNAPAITY